MGYSSPAHPGSDLDSGISDEDRGINWSSVLSLSSQSELDPLNNNTFATEAWPNTANTPTTLSSKGFVSISSLCFIPAGHAHGYQLQLYCGQLGRCRLNCGGQPSTP